MLYVTARGTQQRFLELLVVNDTKYHTLVSSRRYGGALLAIRKHREQRPPADVSHLLWTLPRLPRALWCFKPTAQTAHLLCCKTLHSRRVPFAKNSGDAAACGTWHRTSKSAPAPPCGQDGVRTEAPHVAWAPPCRRPRSHWTSCLTWT